MNLKTTLALLVVAILIGVVVYFAPSAKQADQTAKPAAPAVTAKNIFDPVPTVDAVTHVELEQAGKPKMVFERAAAEPNAPKAAQADYRMLEPVAAPTEAWAVRGLVNAIATLQSRDQFEPGAAGQPSAAEAGLEPPVATVRFTDEAGKTYAVEIGRKVVMSEDTYARKVGEKTILIVKNDVGQQVRKEVADFRAKKLMDFKLDDVASIVVDDAGKKFETARVERGEWLIEAPFRAYADSSKLIQLLTKLTQVRADEFVSDAPASLAMYGLDQPSLTFEVMTEHVPPSTQPVEPEQATKEILEKTGTVTKKVRLLVGGEAGISGDKRYVKLADAPWVATVADATIKGLIPNLKELRDSRVTRVRAADISKLEITSGGQTAVVERTDGTWKGVSGVSEVDPGAINDLLAALESLRAIDYVDDAGDKLRAPDAPYGLAQPRSMITLTAAGLVEPLHLRVGAATATGRNAYLQRNDEPSVLVTTEAQAEKLAVGVLALRSKQVFDLDPDSIKTIEVLRDGLTTRVERDAAGWKLTQPAEAPLNLVAAGALATNLAKLRGSRLVDASEAATFGFDAPLATIKFEYEAPAPGAGPQTQPAAGPRQSQTLRLARHLDAGFAKVGDEAFAYELDESAYKTLAAELIDARIFDFDPNSMATLKIASDRGTLDLVRKDGAWQYAPDPYVALDPVKVNAVVDAVAKLKAESYASWTGGDLAKRGLSESSPASISVTLSDGKTVVARFRPEQPGQCARLGALVDAGRVFHIAASDCDAVFKKLDDLLKSDAPAPAPGRPAMPPPKIPRP